MKISNENTEPKAWTKCIVDSQDVNGNATQTTFYYYGKVVFRWIQEWNAFDKLIEHETIIVD